MAETLGKTKVYNKYSILFMEIAEFSNSYKLSEFLSAINDIYNFHTAIEYYSFSRKISMLEIQKMKKGETKSPNPSVAVSREKEVFKRAYDSLSKAVKIRERIPGELYVPPTVSINNIYDLRLVVPESDSLQIISINQNSDAMFNWKGIGEPIKHIVDFVLKFMKFIRDGKTEKIKRALLQEKVVELRIKNLEAALKVQEKYKLSTKQSFAIADEMTLRQNYIGEMIITDQIRKIDNPPLDGK